MPEIEFKLREFGHPLAIWRLRRRFERSQWFTPEQMAAYQAARLRTVVDHAYARVPYYRELFDAHRLTPSDIKVPADLAKLPRLDKTPSAGRIAACLPRTQPATGPPGNGKLKRDPAAN